MPDQARRATTTRYWPLWYYDPASDTWSIDGNPESRRGVARFEGDFIDDFCRHEGRFRSQFDADGNPSELLVNQTADNLQFWDILRKNAGKEIAAVLPVYSSALILLHFFRTV